MTAVTYPTRSGFPLALLLLGALIIAGIGLMLFAPPSTHATQKHGEGAVAVHQCLEGSSPIMTIKQPSTGQVAYIVCLPNGKARSADR